MKRRGGRSGQGGGNWEMVAAAYESRAPVVAARTCVSRQLGKKESGL